MTNRAKLVAAAALIAAVIATMSDEVVETVKTVAGNASNAVARGLRNNNPLNLRRGVAWAGLDPAGPQKDKSFDVFLSMDYGIRAGLRNMQTAYTKHKCTTLSKLIHRWAPPSENDTAAYVAKVAAAVPLSATQTIPMDDAFTVARIIHEMAKIENGPAEVAKYLPFDQVHKVVQAHI